MVEKTIRDFSSNKKIPPVFCMAIVDGDNVKLESKVKEPKTLSISWNDLVYQVEAAKEEERRKTSK